MSFNKPTGAGFGNVFDLSTLKNPPQDATPAFGKVVTQENLVADFVSKSKEKVIILLCWSPRSGQSKEILEILGKLEQADKDAWQLGTVDVDAQPQVAAALQIKSVPVAIAIIAEQLMPLFESVPPADQVRLVINKLLELASQKGVGIAPEGPTEIPMEAEEVAAFEAMEGLDPVLTLKNAKDDDLTSQLMCADIEIASGNYEAAFDRLLRAVKAFSADDRDKVKAHLISLFNLVDPTDPRLIKARSQLASALF
jgi:putative thioredoxin